MLETTGIIEMGGNPLTLLGEPTKVGEFAQDFTVTAEDLKDVKLSDCNGQVIVISVFPSIDTDVCAAQTRIFNEKATDLGDDVIILTISKDLPFALKRFCAAEGIENVHTLSDYKANDFGLKYGFLIKELQLLTRGVIVIDKDFKIVYVEYVKEIGEEPDYDKAMEAVAKCLKSS